MFHGPSIPMEAGIVLDMTFMDQILRIDEENLVAVVEGGCSIYELQRECFKRGLLIGRLSPQGG